MKKIRLTESELTNIVKRVINEGNLFNNKFLITYQVISYKGNANFDDMNRYMGTDKTSEKESSVYSYIQKAKSEDEAKEIFEDKWNEKANFQPKSKLKIISVQEIGNVSDQIHTY